MFSVIHTRHIVDYFTGGGGRGCLSAIEIKTYSNVVHWQLQMVQMFVVVFLSHLTLSCFCFRPALVMSVAFFWIQLLLAKYVFLADKDTTLALDNRYSKLSGTP